MVKKNRDRIAYFRSTGRGLIPAERKAEEILMAFGSNALLRAELTKPRRHKHHRFFFATISNYYENWPISHEFQPDSEEHLRAWATVRAGYRDIIEGQLSDGPESIHSMASFISRCLTMQQKKGYGFVAVHNGGLVFATPRSIAYDVLDQAAFAPIAEKIFSVLEAETGIPLKTMLENQEKETMKQ